MYWKRGEGGGVLAGPPLLLGSPKVEGAEAKFLWFSLFIGNPPPVRGKNFPLYGPLCGADLFW